MTDLFRMMINNAHLDEMQLRVPQPRPADMGMQMGRPASLMKSQPRQEEE